MGLRSIARELDSLTVECRDLEARVARTAAALPAEFLVAATAEVTALLLRLDALASEVGAYEATAHTGDITGYGLESAG